MMALYDNPRSIHSPENSDYQFLNFFKMFEKNSKSFIKFFNQWPNFCKQKLSFNIKQEWNRFSMKILPTRIFHNDLVASSCSFDDFIDHKHFNRNLVKNSLDYYSNYLHKWLNHSTSFGLIYQHSLQSIPSRIDQEYNYDHSHIDIGLSLVLFCNQKETLSIQQMLTRTRYHCCQNLQ
ncbi:mucin-19-like [Sarcoptes scabiei]|nr:mucin-19-like [Sarcoptes scabiei]